MERERVLEEPGDIDDDLDATPTYRTGQEAFSGQRTVKYWNFKLVFHKFKFNFNLNINMR